MYYEGTTVTCYNGQNNQTTICPTNKLDDASKSLIDNHIWNTGAAEFNTRTDTLSFYNAERGTKGKICSSGNQCNDTVERTTTWTGYVGLPYVTDWAYASSESICETNMDAKDSSNAPICKNNNWMHYGSTSNDVTWYLSPIAVTSDASIVWRVHGGGRAGSSFASYAFAFFPAIYLKSNILIESGTGTSSDPYILKAGS